MHEVRIRRYLGAQPMTVVVLSFLPTASCLLPTAFCLLLTAFSCRLPLPPAPDSAVCVLLFPRSPRRHYENDSVARRPNVQGADDCGFAFTNADVRSQPGGFVIDDWKTRTV